MKKTRIITEAERYVEDEENFVEESNIGNIKINWKINLGYVGARKKPSIFIIPGVHKTTEAPYNTSSYGEFKGTIQEVIDHITKGYDEYERINDSDQIYVWLNKSKDVTVSLNDYFEFMHAIKNANFESEFKKAISGTNIKEVKVKELDGTYTIIK